ncbi:hypothetical protein [Bradyrhizobium sp. USDA 4353]
MDNQISFIAGPYRCVGSRVDRHWGHALELSLHDRDSGDVLYEIVFACQPAFDGYDELQALSTEQLSALAQARLESGTLDELLTQARAAKLRLLVRFEAPASSMHPGA